MFALSLPEAAEIRAPFTLASEIEHTNVRKKMVQVFPYERGGQGNEFDKK